MKNGMLTIATLIVMFVVGAYLFVNDPKRTTIMGTSQISVDPTTLVDSVVTQYHQNPVGVTVLLVVTVFLMLVLWRRR